MFISYRRTTDQFRHAKFVNAPNVPQMTDITAERTDSAYDNIDRKVAYEQSTTNSAVAAGGGPSTAMENPLYKTKEETPANKQKSEPLAQYTTIDVKF